MHRCLQLTADAPCPVHWFRGEYMGALHGKEDLLLGLAQGYLGAGYAQLPYMPSSAGIISGEAERQEALQQLRGGLLQAGRHAPPAGATGGGSAPLATTSSTHAAATNSAAVGAAALAAAAAGGSNAALALASSSSSTAAAATAAAAAAAGAAVAAAVEATAAAGGGIAAIATAAAAAAGAAVAAAAQVAAAAAGGATHAVKSSGAAAAAAAGSGGGSRLGGSGSTHLASARTAGDGDGVRTAMEAGHPPLPPPAAVREPPLFLAPSGKGRTLQELARANQAATTPGGQHCQVTSVLADQPMPALPTQQSQQQPQLQRLQLPPPVHLPQQLQLAAPPLPLPPGVALAAFGPRLQPGVLGNSAAAAAFEPSGFSGMAAASGACLQGPSMLAAPTAQALADCAVGVAVQRPTGAGGGAPAQGGAAGDAGAVAEGGAGALNTQALPRQPADGGRSGRRDKRKAPKVVPSLGAFQTVQGIWEWWIGAAPGSQIGGKSPQQLEEEDSHSAWRQGNRSNFSDLNKAIAAVNKRIADITAAGDRPAAALEAAAALDAEFRAHRAAAGSGALTFYKWVRDCNCQVPSS